MSQFPVESTAKIEPFAKPFRTFARVEAAGGIVLIAATIIALVWANSPWSQSYVDLWKTYLTIQVEGGVDSIGQQDVVQDIEVFQQLELLKHQTEIPDAKRATPRI